MEGTKGLEQCPDTYDTMALLLCFDEGGLCLVACDAVLAGHGLLADHCWATTSLYILLE